MTPPRSGFTQLNFEEHEDGGAVVLLDVEVHCQ